MASVEETSPRRPRLTATRERRLAARIAQGDEQARNELVEANLGLVVWIARRYRDMGLDFADLVQEGNVGLLRATGHFDPARGRFATCAHWWIRQAICHALGTQSRTIRVPQRLAASAAFRRGERRTLSLDEPRSDGKTIADGLPDAAAHDAVDAIAEADGHAAVRRACESLDARRRRVVELRYGLDGGGERTLAQVAGELHVSAPRARHLELRALHELAAHPALEALRAA